MKEFHATPHQTSMNNNLFATIALVCLLLAAMLISVSQPSTIAQDNGTLQPFSADATLHPDYRLVEQVLRNQIPAINDPQFITADEADAMYGPDELVIGVQVDGDVRAYSVPLLSRHEIVNDVVGGVPVAITWCPLCFSAVVYERAVGDDVLTFEVSGLLLNNNLVMVDRQSDSLWPQTTGIAIQGPLTASVLTFRASVLSTWSLWRTQHPNTLALRNDGTRLDVYQSYYQSDAVGVSNQPDIEDRLPAKSFVYGVNIDNNATAYPFTTLACEIVVNDTLGGMAVVVVFAENGDTALAYERTLADGTVLTFERGVDALSIIDMETGSVWDAWRGVATSGPLTGETLLRVRGLRVFWFHWRSLHPDTTVFGIG